MLLVQKGDSAQISIAPRAFTDALRFFVDLLKREKNYFALIKILKRCIRILRGPSLASNTVLTFAHCDLMYCCIETYSYHLAYPEINDDIIQVQGDGCIASIDNLRYFYYAGLVWIALKKYRRAMECLTMVLCAPTESVSLIQVDAYKKYILISLIRKQKLIPLPRYTPRVLNRYLSKLCSEYLELSNLFSATITSKETYEKVINKNAELYAQEHNFGLVKQVVLSIQKNNVLKLTSIYTKLGIDKVCELCDFSSVEEAKRIVILMISEGSLSASINHENVVTFYDGSITESDSQMLNRIQTGIEKTLNLWNALDVTQLKIKQSKSYVEKSLNLPSSGPSHGSALDAEMQQQLLFGSLTGQFFGGRGGL
jgi:COP9 signalosome complex subunit 3